MARIKVKCREGTTRNVKGSRALTVIMVLVVEHL